MHIDRLKSQDTVLIDFDETLWTYTIDKIVIVYEILHFILKMELKLNRNYDKKSE
ncbi:MAG: hypothetical protein KZY61_08990 [Clostridiaceae bacterium]|nr:hypothetical protein [Clostridiaceae bacterium]MBW4858495.1 hypothetical protein [Clostridiaceae bacterium]MBW4868782.1 hypothetical protein [Clostridiaceae bacterium]